MVRCRGAVSRSSAALSRVPCSSGITNRPAKVPSPLSYRVHQVSASARSASAFSWSDSCRSATSTETTSNIRRATCRSRFAFNGRPDRDPTPVAFATNSASAAANCSPLTPAGARSAARTITRTCSTRNRPAANASRVAGYVSCNRRANHNPPEATSRGSAVNRINHAVVSVSAVSSATRRASASAANASRHAATWDSNADSSAIASPSSCADSAAAGTDNPSPTARRACATHAAACPGARSWVIVIRQSLLDTDVRIQRTNAGRCGQTTSAPESDLRTKTQPRVRSWRSRDE